MTNAEKRVVVSGRFDDIRWREVRFLQEVARLGPLHVFLWNDELVRSTTGEDPTFPEQERLYFVRAIRFVHQVHLVAAPAGGDELPSVRGVDPAVWVVREQDDTPAKKRFCRQSDLQYCVVTNDELKGFPDAAAAGPDAPGPRKKVLVTGCYDWFHTGHIRFFEEVSELGDLYVVVGHDANIRLLKGQGHPMFPQEQRRYMVGSIRYVAQALISTGNGWLDAEPEIECIGPDIYAVNEDGDKLEKGEYCQRHGIEYVVLKRLPKPGLPKRESTRLRGF